MKRLKIFFKDGTDEVINNVRDYNFNKEEGMLYTTQQTDMSIFAIEYKDHFKNVERVQEILHNRKVVD